MLVLGVETSCDETAIALFCSKKGIINQKLYSHGIHAKYGGVVPELASREHQRYLRSLMEEVLAETGETMQTINCLACTRGPGLIGSLIVGWQFCLALACFNKLPIIGVNHLEAHILTHLLHSDTPQTPFLALLVSGGHTQLIYVKNLGEYIVVGSTRDDASGEAFDKGAKLLGLPYPGGPAISDLAIKADPNHSITFTRPFSGSKHFGRKDFSFSFSGLKTQLRMFLSSGSQAIHNKHNVAQAYQRAIVDSLVDTTMRASNKWPTSSIVLAGGVSCNQLLRNEMEKKFSERGISVIASPVQLCTDNGAMIAHLGYLRRKEARMVSAETINFQPIANWPLDLLNPIQ